MKRRDHLVPSYASHKGLWEDFFDAYVAHQRRNEPREFLAKVKQLIEAKDKCKARG